MRKIQITTAIAGLTLTLFVPLAAFAQTNTSTAVPTTVETRKEAGEVRETKEVKAVTKATALTNVETNLKNRADKEINRRTADLNKLISRINAFKHLTSAQKVAFSAAITTEITNLAALRAKINADTDATILRTDVKSVVTNYRVFAFYIPQIRLLETADRILNLADELNTFAGNLQLRITALQSAGGNAASLQALLTDIQNKTKDATTVAQNVITTVEALTPANYPDNKTALQSAKTNLMTAKKDLETARSEAKTIISSLKVTQKTLPTTTPTTPTPTKTQ